MRATTRSFVSYQRVVGPGYASVGADCRYGGSNNNHTVSTGSFQKLFRFLKHDVAGCHGKTLAFESEVQRSPPMLKRNANPIDSLERLDPSGRPLIPFDTRK
jgi:hypothetical protein